MSFYFVDKGEKEKEYIKNFYLDR